MESHGKAAERVVAERVGAALPADAYHPYPNAEWLGIQDELARGIGAEEDVAAGRLARSRSASPSLGGPLSVSYTHLTLPTILRV